MLTNLVGLENVEHARNVLIIGQGIIDFSWLNGLRTAFKISIIQAFSVSLELHMQNTLECMYVFSAQVI